MRLIQHPQSDSVPLDLYARPPYAFPLLCARLFRTSNLACFLNTMTLNRSKSLNSFLRASFALDLAYTLLLNLSSTFSDSHFFLRPVDPTASGSLGMTMLVSETCERGVDWRGTWWAGSEEGPSMRTYR